MDQPRTLEACQPRRFVLDRKEDVTGVSGTGVVAEGVLFSSGVVAVCWLSEFPTSVVFHDRGIESIYAVHGHHGQTEIVWLDTDRDAHDRRTERGEDPAPNTAGLSTRDLLMALEFRMDATQNSIKGRDLGRLCREARESLDPGVLDHRPSGRRGLHVTATLDGNHTTTATVHSDGSLNVAEYLALCAEATRALDSARDTVREGPQEAAPPEDEAPAANPAFDAQGVSVVANAIGHAILSALREPLHPRYPRRRPKDLGMHSVAAAWSHDVFDATPAEDAVFREAALRVLVEIGTGRP